MLLNAVALFSPPLENPKSNKVPLWESGMFAGLWNRESSPSTTHFSPRPPSLPPHTPNKLDWPSAITQGLPFTRESREAG